MHQPLAFFDANIFFPEPLTLAYAENQLGLSLLVAPIFWLTGNALLTVNTALLLAYAAGGLAMYLLVEDLTGRRGPALVAGTAFTVLPYRLAHAVHMHVLMPLLPLVVLALFRLERGVTRRRVVALALAVTVQFWVALTAGLFACVIVATWAGWQVLRRRRASWHLVSRAGMALAVGVLLALPVLVPYLALHLEHPEFKRSPDEIVVYSATPKSYLLPNDRAGPVVRPAYTWMRERFMEPDGAGEKTLWPGFWLAAGFPLTLGGVALAVTRRNRERPLGNWVATFGFLVVLAIAAGVLSLGPFYGAKYNGANLPYWVLMKLIPKGLMRQPARFGVLAHLAMIAAVAVGLAAVRVRPRRWLLALSLAVILVEAMPTSLHTVRPPKVETAHRALAGGRGAVLALPTAVLGRGSDARDQSVVIEAIHMYLSTAHFRPLVNGYAGFYPDSYWEVVRAVQQFPSATAFDFLRRRQVTTVVVQTELVPGTPWEGTADRLERWPGVRPIGRGATVRVYDITAAGPVPS